MRGKWAVTTDTEKIPNGSCQNTTALASAEVLPSSRPEANTIATCWEIANMEADATTGTHCRTMRRTRGSDQWKSGRTS